jgi:trans-aconitate methyltransferase
MSDMYHGWMATRYDTLWHTFTARMLAPVLDLAQASLVPPARVLDAGCGTGVLLERLMALHPHLVGWGADAV